MLRHPCVGYVVSARCIRRGSVKMEWQQISNRRVRGVRGIGLLERCTVFRESSHAAIAPKIVIEGPIFLDEDDHVFDILQFAAGAGTRRNIRSDCQTTATLYQKTAQFGDGRGPAKLQYLPARKISKSHVEYL